MPRRTLTSLAAAVLVTAAVGFALPAAPAEAAACSTGAGVTVVVDYEELGGGVQQVCDASGGGDTATTLFTSNGFPLTYAQRQPGFVCRVSGVPTSDPCVNTSPADAYWGLWWSDGKTGRWAYASTSAGSLRIPEGGYVAFAWDGKDGQTQPAAAPAAHASNPTPTPTQSTPTPTQSSSAGGHHASNGTPGSSGSGGVDPTSPTSTPTAGSSPSASASEDPSGTPTTRPTRAPSGTASSTEMALSSESASSPTPDGAVDTPQGAPADAGDNGLPLWVTPILIGLIFVAAGATVWHRRRMSPPR
ncbi:hypothetical protein [Nocardioides sp.]|uniref:hypothetical protein n=1 Tax=Nocardioides sp. TaxID=35761 RepID=UPI0031FE556F|nr:hypothetical protein [Nocardioides sp.]